MTGTALTKDEKRADLATPERTRGTRGVVTYTPRCDILETEDELIVYADMPGTKSEQVDVRLENGQLEIFGKCEPRVVGASEDFLIGEYGVGDFYRAFAVNEVIDANKIEAQLKHGVLTVRIPKSESSKPKRITVKAN